MRVSVIIPSFNGKLLLEKNLPYLRLAVENHSNKIGEIIVVDDGSSDESANFLKAMFPEVRVVKHKKNRGFSATVNTGVRSAKYELLCLLNNDVKPSNDFLDTVHKHFKDKKVFAVSLHEKGYGWAKGYFEDGFVGYSAGEENTKVNDTFWVSGGSGVFRRAVWMSLGGLDEKLFSPFYWEDLDISYRAQKRGYRVLWEPGAEVLHEHESTTKNLSKIWVSRIKERNQLLFIWKNITSPNLIRRHRGALIKRIIAHPGYLIIFFKAAVKLGSVLAARAKERKEAIVSDEAIFSKFHK